MRSGRLLLSILCLTAPLASSAPSPATARENAPASAEHEPRSEEKGVEDTPATGDTGPDILRRRPGAGAPSPTAPDLPPPALPAEFVPVPDRWRIVESLGVSERWWDPYHQNTLKADRPLFGDDWFLNVTLLSDSLVEPRRLPTPVGIQTTRSSGALDVFGDGEQLLLSQSLLLSVSLIQGDTVFRPPDWEFRLTAVQNWNHTIVQENRIIDIDPGEGRTRFDHDFGIQEAFVDRHLWNKSDRYDFDSIRVGIQGFSSDFRGFLFQDNAPGVRLFGNHWNNRLQYNLAWFVRMEKDINSGLNEKLSVRDDHLIIANVYLQDFPVLGFTVQGIVAYDRNREGNERPFFDKNGFLQRPAVMGDGRAHDYDVVYLGLNGDGHIGRVNLTFSGYWALGEDKRHPLAMRDVSINAFFGALEASMDFDWFRLKAFGLYASGDNDPDDGAANGFDAIFENPQFAGADTSFWHRQAIPFIGGGGVVLSGRNGLIPSLRSSKEQGQSNFVGPGIGMLGIGADFDILPQLRLSVNASYLDFENTSSLRRLRNQGRIDNHIGEDVSAALVFRPFFTENVVLRVSGAVFFPGDGLQQLFDDEQSPFYSVLTNLILRY